MQLGLFFCVTLTHLVAVWRTLTFLGRPVRGFKLFKSRWLLLCQKLVRGLILC
jgi:hypothetical protein